MAHIVAPPTRDSSALQLLAELNPQAVGAGDHELKLGARYLLQKAGSANYPWLGNIWPAQNNFTAFQFTRLGRMQIAFTRLALPANRAPTRAERKRISRKLSQLKKHYDLLILLGNFNAQSSLIASALFPQANIIIGNVDSKQLDTIGNTIVAPAEAVNPYLGGIEIALRDGNLAAWRGGIISYPLTEYELP